MLDAATELEGEGSPTPGAISMCMYCGAIAVFADDLKLRKATRLELDELRFDDDFGRQFYGFQWARQVVMLDSSLMRDDGEDPDR